MSYMVKTVTCSAVMVAALMCAGCRSSKPEARAAENKPKPSYPTLGSVERVDKALDDLIAPDAKIEKLAEGFDWSEGPVWMKRGEYLLFSDVPKNIVFKWKEGEKIAEFLKPSGYTASKPRGGEPGSNGLTTDANGMLVLCQHGDRRVVRLEKNGSFTPIAQFYQYRRFNSPNDLDYKANGDLYFTDPPYGLEKLNNDPAKELSYNGVFRVTPKGQVNLVIDNLTFPNGIAFSPDEKTLYVAISDPKKPYIMAYDVKPDGTLVNGRIFFNATTLTGPDRKGLPDGLKVDRKGNLFATGPGGVLVISPEGKLLGTILTGEATANCGWGNGGSVLYITADMYLCRIQTRTRGKGF
jgi:gluconolactonase